jgi:hypothetical protein
MILDPYRARGAILLTPTSSCSRNGVRTGSGSMKVPGVGVQVTGSGIVSQPGPRIQAPHSAPVANGSKRLRPRQVSTTSPTEQEAWDRHGPRSCGLPPALLPYPAHTPRMKGMRGSTGVHTTRPAPCSHLPVHSLPTTAPHTQAHSDVSNGNGYKYVSNSIDDVMSDDSNQHQRIINNVVHIRINKRGRGMGMCTSVYALPSLSVSQQRKNKLETEIISSHCVCGPMSLCVRGGGSTHDQHSPDRSVLAPRDPCSRSCCFAPFGTEIISP